MALVKRVIQHQYSPEDLIDNDSTIDGSFMLALANKVEEIKPRVARRIGIYPFTFVGGFFRPSEHDPESLPNADKEVVQWMHTLVDAMGCEHSPFLEGKNIPVVGAYSLILMDHFPDVIRDLYANIHNGENSRLVLKEIEFYSLAYKRMNKSAHPNLKQNILVTTRYIWNSPRMAQSNSTLLTIDETVKKSNMA